MAGLEAERMRADSDSAIQFGRSLGIAMFQGHQVDRQLEMRAVA